MLLLKVASVWHYHITHMHIFCTSHTCTSYTPHTCKQFIANHLSNIFCGQNGHEMLKTFKKRSLVSSCSFALWLSNTAVIFNSCAVTHWCAPKCPQHWKLLKTLHTAGRERETDHLLLQADALEKELQSLWRISWKPHQVESIEKSTEVSVLSIEVTAILEQSSWETTNY